jgi:Icc-related predicted phosphoesterase
MRLLDKLFKNKLNVNIGEKYENTLLKKYGNCKQLIHYGIKILFITDTHNCLAYTDEYIKYLESLKQEDYDICLLLGDISGPDFDIIKRIIPNEKLYGIVGNHDSLNALEMNNIKNITGKVIECKGVKIAAIMGSNRYKNGDYGMMTQEECLQLEQNMERADILVSHDKAYIYDRHDNVHDGLKGITDYIYRNHIPLHIHGHLHEEFEEILKNGTKSIGLFQVKLIEI